jgi:hypothetical protein
MNHEPSDASGATELERHSRTRLRASAEALEVQVQSRLTRARHAALGELPERGGVRFRVPGVWLPTGALAAAAVLAVAVWLAQPAGNPGGALAEASPVEDVEILASNDGPELVAEDAEFYEWAGADAADGAAGSSG